MGQIPPSRSPLARRLTLALATMLLPVAAVAAAGLVTFRLSTSALDEFRQETVEESRRIEAVRNLLGHAAGAAAGSGGRCAVGEVRGRYRGGPKASATDDRLDPFHDNIDQAVSKLGSSPRTLRS